MLFDCVFTAVALAVHAEPDGNTQTPLACAKLEAVLALAPSAPRLSLSAAPAVRAPEISTLSSFSWSSPPFSGISTKPTVVGNVDGSVAVLAMKACPLTVCAGGMPHSSVCTKSTSAIAFDTITSTRWFPTRFGWRSDTKT